MHITSGGHADRYIDAIDGSIVVVSGWQDICVKFHRANPVSLQRFQERDNYIETEAILDAEQDQHGPAFVAVSCPEPFRVSAGIAK